MPESAVIRAQSYAVSIEVILRRVFECDRCGFGGIINSDYIRQKPIPAMYCGLAYIYATAQPDKKAQIEQFIEEHDYYDDMSLDFLLSFETNTKDDGDHHMEIEYPNGEEAVIKIIEKFRNITR